MATLVMTFDTSDVQKTIRALKTRFPRAVRRALNRAAVSARTRLASDVAKDMKLKVGDVRDALTIQEATDTRHVAAVFATTKRLDLYDFLPGGGDPRGPYPSRGRRMLRIRGKSYPGAFIARVGGQKWGVFRRRGESVRKSPGAWSKNLPIVKLRGASIWQSAMKHQDAARARGMESLVKNLASELRFAATVESSSL